MSAARAEVGSRVSRLPESKGRELWGVLMLVAGLLLLVSLLSYHPLDPSLLHQTAEGAPTGNLIGPFGAQLAALGYGFLGLPILVAPALLLVAAVRRLRAAGGETVVGRGVGATLLLASLPPLMQLLLGTLSWRGEALEAGGAIGVFLAEVLQGRFGFLGGLLLSLGVLLVGCALVVQSSLEEVLRDLARRFRSMIHDAVLAYERHRERRERERSRREVVVKQLDRARHLAQQAGPEGDEEAVFGRGADEGSADEGSADERSADGGSAAWSRQRLRVTERKGEREFALRRVAGDAKVPEEAAESTRSPSRSALPVERPRRSRAKTSSSSPPQQHLAFPSADPHALPPLNLLSLDEETRSISEDALVQLGEVIKSRCAEFGVAGAVEGISPGPLITVFEFQPAPGVKVSQIVNLQDDLALSLKAEAIRIDRIPGRSTLGIEVPNQGRSTIRLGPLLAEDEFKQSPSCLTMALGRTLHGHPYFGDLATMPHLLVAGATGAGKSVGLQSMITSVLYKARSDEVKFIFIDPKRIELGVYADIPHLKTEVVVEPKKAANALRWAVAEMERRYRLLAEVHVRSIDHYNRAIVDPEVQKRLSLRDEDPDEELSSEELQPLPYYVVVIDELADLMMVAAAEVEGSIARLAQMARAVGIHLIVATQRPSVDVLTGTIKANFPCRMAFATATRHDSRTILDQIGAEKLLGKGDMLLLPAGSSRPIRLHGAYVSEQETAALVRWLKRQGKPVLDPEVLKPPTGERAGPGDGAEGGDELFDEAARLVVSEGQGSASFLQRRMRVGFSRAARLIDMLEQDGILGPAQGSKPREVLVKRDYFEEVDSREA